MAGIRNILGLVAGVILVISSAAHSLLGWKALREELAVAQVPPDLVVGLKIGWQLGAVAILAMGVIVLSLFAKRHSGKSVSIFPVTVIAIAYLGFGAWAFLASGFNPFFFIFIAPGTLMAFAASGSNGGTSTLEASSAG